MSVQTKTETRTYSTDVPVSIRCDRCDSEILLGPSSRAGGRIRADGFWFGSNIDGYGREWDLCDGCVPELEAWFTATSNQDRAPVERDPAMEPKT